MPFRVAMLGGKVPVTLPVTEACPTCGGSGAAPGAKITTCPECKGRGTISFGQGASRSTGPARRAAAAAASPRSACPTCSGAGDVRIERQVMITVPPATETGTKVRLKGQGQPGRGGAPAGDLIVIFKVEPDRFFHRDGLDLACEVPINLAQALLGTRLRVRTLDGKKIVLKVPPGTQPGRKFRIKGQGLERGGRRGDQIVAVRVELPEKLTPEQEALAKQLADAAGAQVLGERPGQFRAAAGGWRSSSAAEPRLPLAGRCRRAAGPTPGGCPPTSSPARRASSGGAAGPRSGPPPRSRRSRLRGIQSAEPM